MAATLVADDDANIRELVCLFFCNDGFETLEAAMRSKPNNPHRANASRWKARITCTIRNTKKLPGNLRRTCSKFNNMRSTEWNCGAVLGAVVFRYEHWLLHATFQMLGTLVNEERGLPL
ncbi:hypothetical protein PAECIP111890_01301 [Paenibacillus sp. JJ-223]|nr:hypothetical protein PAECIP111890_01301 [Paenibacillus sp. JJ-223]